MATKTDFTAIMKILQKGSFPFAVYRLPGEDTVNVMIDRSEDLHVVNDANTDRGFVFAPFASDTLPWVLLHPGAMTRFPVTDLPDTEQMPFDDTAVDYGDYSAKEHYRKLVNGALEALQEDTLQKIVVSRRVLFPDVKVDLAGLFSALVRKYPEAFVYCFSHPRIGRWLGASPELLLLRRGKRLRTMALAGTLPYKGEEQVYRWDRKNVEEQAMVSVFIKDALERSGLAAVSVSHPANQSAGPVVHLCSRIEGQIPDGVDMNLLLKNLAPTPALCGYPRGAAMEFLRRFEGYSREFYGGYLGELNMSGADTAELYVNIRCLQVVPQGVFLYAGGGIVPGSDPETEWEETVRKLSTVAPLVARHSREQ